MSKKSSKEELRVVRDLNEHIRALHKICEAADMARLKAEADAARLRTALVEIRDGRAPQVCRAYDVCTHVGCNSSHAAYEIAHAALRITPAESEVKK